MFTIKLNELVETNWWKSAALRLDNGTEVEDRLLTKTVFSSLSTGGFYCQSTSIALVRPVYLKRMKVNMIETVFLDTTGRLLPAPRTCPSIQSRRPRLSGDKKREGITVFFANSTLNRSQARRVICCESDFSD